MAKKDKKAKKTDWKTKWVAIAGGGLSVAIFVGGGAYIMPFVNLSDPTKILWVAVSSKKLGAVVHAGVNHVIGYISGVTGAADIKGLKAGGFDFSLDIGAKVGAAMKASGKLKKVIDALRTANDGLKKSMVNKNRLIAEAGKDFVNLVDGDLSADKKGRKLLLFGTPVGAGIGAGVFYEWQTAYALGGPNAWTVASKTVKWRLTKEKGQLWLQTVGMPEQDGKSVAIRLRLEKTGRDPILYFHVHTDIKKHTVGSDLLFGSVESLSLQNGSQSTLRNGGMNLKYRLLGTRTANGTDFEYHPIKNRKVGLCLEILIDKSVKWESNEYQYVRTNDKGEIDQVCSRMFVK